MKDIVKFNQKMRANQGRGIGNQRISDCLIIFKNNPGDKQPRYMQAANYYGIDFREMMKILNMSQNVS